MLFNSAMRAGFVIVVLATPIWNGCGGATENGETNSDSTSKKVTPYAPGTEWIESKLGSDGTFSKLVREDTGTNDGTGISIFDGWYKPKEGDDVRWRVVTNDEQSFVYGWRLDEKVECVVENEFLKRNIVAILDQTPSSLAEKYLKRKYPELAEVTVGSISQNQLADRTLVWIVDGSLQQGEKEPKKYRVITNPTYTFVFCSRIDGAIQFEIEGGSEDSDLGRLLKSN